MTAGTRARRSDRGSLFHGSTQQREVATERRARKALLARRQLRRTHQRFFRIAVDPSPNPRHPRPIRLPQRSDRRFRSCRASVGRGLSRLSNGTRMPRIGRIFSDQKARTGIFIAMNGRLHDRIRENPPDPRKSAADSIATNAPCQQDFRQHVVEPCSIQPTRPRSDLHSPRGGRIISELVASSGLFPSNNT